MLEVLMEEGKFRLRVKFLWSYLEGADYYYTFKQLLQLFQLLVWANQPKKWLNSDIAPILSIYNPMNMLNIFELNFQYIVILDLLMKQWIMATAM